MIVDRTLGDSIRFETTFRDEDGNLFDPDTTGGYVYGPDGSILATASALVRQSLGVFTYDWQTDKVSTPKGSIEFEGWGTYGMMTYRTRSKIVRLT